VLGKGVGGSPGRSQNPPENMIDDLTCVSEDVFLKYVEFHHSHHPLGFERTTKGYFYWYGISLMAAKWVDDPKFYVSTPDYEMFLEGKSLYKRQDK